MALSFDLAADHARVAGRERVVFTPDQPVRELVFRLWPNGPEGGRTGAELRVARASVLGSSRFQVAAAGGRPDTPGTLLTVPLPGTVPAGEAVTADLEFTLTLPPARSDRLGHTATTAWWASSHPLLAWQRGRGWVREPAVPLAGETAVSEAARLDLTVTAPAADTVLTTGAADAPVADGGRRRWHSTASAVRDVSVAVAPFRLATGRAGGVPVTVGMAPEVAQPPQEVLAEATRAVAALAARFGPYPFEALTMAAVPGVGGSGIEYPGVILLGDTPSYRIVVTHEVAHQWFYGLVGDDQGRDPWLDEAFATYAEALVNRDQATYLPMLSVRDAVGLPMSAFGVDVARYVLAVYGKGAAALLTARQRAGPAAFDAALRCYLARNAWRVAAPEDVARALAGLPPALTVLRRAGALR